VIVSGVDNYLVEGEQLVRRRGREPASNGRNPDTVVAGGLVLDRLVEWGPSAEPIEERPGLADDLQRPGCVLLQATRPSG